MAATKTTLTVTRDRLQQVLQTIPGVKVYDHEPLSLDSLPCAWLGLPTITRVSVDDRETQLGSDTWLYEWPVTIADSLDVPERGHNAALELVAQAIGAFDEDETLTGTVGTPAPGIVRAAMVSAEAEHRLNEETSQRYIVWTCSVQVLHEVA